MLDMAIFTLWVLVNHGGEWGGEWLQAVCQSLQGGCQCLPNYFMQLDPGSLAPDQLLQLIADAGVAMLRASERPTTSYY